MQRRDVLKSMVWGLGAGLAGSRRAWARSAGPRELLHTRLAALEARHGGRLGVAMLDTGTGAQLRYRADHRFMMCSTHKVLTVAAILARVDRGTERLDRRVVYGRDVLLEYAPTTRAHVGPPGMTIEALCQAAITLSDNTADNLLLAQLGGPEAVTGFVRSLGDHITWLARTEPALNYAMPDDHRDTTTPDAMLADLKALLLGTALSPASRLRLLGWMQACQTGTQMLRAGLAAHWRCGDKTGSGPANELNDVAIVHPPGAAPLLITSFYAESVASLEERHGVIADIGRLAVTLHA
ncbi:class A beta-lactamase [Oleiagrimonas sp. C23AA]|uniref:class A beta-lactamase n=1 Tax=Oleiagrimonas sp. C23AA TaxID=2719047 RepID=UPI001420A718|nr:class A beta-lactamase [Oleiagrimonas sp. C23AA]NII09878.1 class A beta-lactamase [Oleiagrimonas sp. C23AA]